MPLYRVVVPGIGELLKTDDNIKAARTWARVGFPRVSCVVSVHVEPRRAGCRCCGLSPCLYRRGLGLKR
jgi:hypothetical protein